MKPDEILQRVALKANIPEAKLSDNVDPSAARPRRWAAKLLSEPWPEEDAGRIQHKLNCSKRFVHSAKSLAEEDSADGELFRSELREIKGEKTEVVTTSDTSLINSKSDESPKFDQAEKVMSIEALLFKVAKEHFGFSHEELFQKKTSVKVADARRVLTYLAKEVFEMKNDAIAKMLQCELDTVRRQVRDTVYDIQYDARFRQNVQGVAKRFGISLERKKVLMSV